MERHVELINGVIADYTDIRFVYRPKIDFSELKQKLTAEKLMVLNFNLRANIPESVLKKTNDVTEILEKGKNPGLGVRDLHKKYTGKGIAVGIIDQPMFLNHPEYAGKIKSYWRPEVQNASSMHGPAVTSLLVGNSMGTAPDATVHYAVSRSWLEDEGEDVRALLHLIELNKGLPQSDKIRVISVSAAPTDQSLRCKNTESIGWLKAVEYAKQNDILVLDCTPESGRIWVGHRDLHDPDNFEKFTFGYQRDPNRKKVTENKELLYVPTECRTTAEHFIEDEPSYAYFGNAGDSWAIPYVAGILALGLQVAPSLSVFMLYDLLFATAYIKEGKKIINPVEFIKQVTKLST